VSADADTPDVSWSPPQGGLFSLRAAAILVRAGRVMPAHTDGQDHWYLPGGRVKLGEPAVAARRELREELGLADPLAVADVERTRRVGSGLREQSIRRPGVATARGVTGSRRCRPRRAPRR
jgi:8-oxo-dGTP pyrophosphatase MutT (NUDIX family)